MELIGALIDKISEPSKKMAESLNKVAEKTGLLEKALEHLDKVGGEHGRNALGQFTKKSNGLGEALGAVAGPVAAVDTAFIAFAGAAVVAAGAGADLAIEVTETNAKMRAMFDVMGKGKVSGQEIMDSLDDMRDSLGMTREQLAPFAQKLLAAKTPASELKTQLAAIASVQAVNPEGVAAYTKALEKLNVGAKISAKDLLTLQESGVDVNAIAKQLGYEGPQGFAKLSKALSAGTISADKFKSAMTKAVTESGAPALENQANSLASVWANFTETLKDLFDVGGALEPLGAAFKEFAQIFDKNTASGKMMKTVIGGFFSSVFKWAAQVLPYIERGFLHVLIAGLKVYLALKPYFGQIAVVLGYVWLGIKTMGIVLGVVIGVVLAAAAGLIALQVALFALGVYLVKTIASGAIALAEWIAGAPKAASDFIMGLVDGIKNGAGMVLDAVKGLGSDMLKGIKGVLGIHSPSKAMFNLGSFTSQGFAQGVTAANDNIVSAGAGMGAAVSKGVAQGPAPAAAGSGGGAGGTVTINVQSGAVVINGAQGDATEMTETALSLLLERIAEEQGLGTAA